MKIIQSYLQGAKHKAKGQPCEDRTFSLCKNNVGVIALADGAGNQRYTHSAQGAECVTQTIANFFCDNFDKFYQKDDVEELQKVLMVVCQNALEEKAKELNVDNIIRLSSTLLCVAIKEEKVIICHVGDGAVGKLTPSGIQVVSGPENGEFASATYFITNPIANNHINIIKENTSDTISYFLMSDGTYEYLYDEKMQTFNDGARKMALLPYNSTADTKLKQIINDFMIKQDSLSDDCSYICALLDNEVESEKIKDEEKDKKDKYEKEHLVVADEKIQSEQKEKTENDEKSKYKEKISLDIAIKGKKQRLNIGVALAVVGVVVIIVGTIIGIRSSDKDKSNTTQKVSSSQTTIQQSSTSTTSSITANQTTSSQQSTSKNN